MAKTAGTTPLLRHAFEVLQAWLQAKLGDVIPWQHIKSRSTYIPPTPSSHAASGGAGAKPSTAPAVVLPAPAGESATRPAIPASTVPTGVPMGSVVQANAMDVDKEPVPRRDKGKGRETDREGMIMVGAPEAKWRKIMTEGQSHTSGPVPLTNLKNKTGLV